MRLFFRLLPSKSHSSITNPINLTRSISTKLNFSFPGYDVESDSETEKKANLAKSVATSKLPPPYDPFKKTTAVEDTSDPKDLQYIFHRMRTEGLHDYAAKMFDGLTQDGLAHEALELFSEINVKGKMPDVIAFTSVIEAYANAGQAKEAQRTFMKMLSSGVAPNAYTYAVVVKLLTRDGNLKDAEKYLVEMMGKGIKPNAATYVGVVETLVKGGKCDEARKVVEEMEKKGFKADETEVRNAIGCKRGMVFKNVMSVLFGQNIY